MSAVSYICAIPPELLSRIFLLVKHNANPQSADDRRGRLSPLPIQETCARVSVHFREVALGTAFLWTTIKIGRHSVADRVAAYCDRSSTAPLDVWVDLHGSWASDAKVLSSVFDSLAVVADHRHRWHRLSLDLNRDPITQRSVIDLLCRCPAPMIEYLSLSTHSIDEEELPQPSNSPTAPTVFMKSSISFLRLRGVAVHYFLPPLGSLAILHLETNTTRVSYSTFKGILTSSSTLKHLSVHGETVDRPQWPLLSAPATLISLPALKSLRICGTEGPVYAGIIFNIDAPLLDSLTLKAMLDGDLVYGHMGNFTSFPQIKVLTFCDFDLSDLGFLSMYKLFPSIETFNSPSTTIEVSRACKSLCALTGPGHAVPWPNLHTLDLGWDDMEDPVSISLLNDARGALGRPLSGILFRTGEEELIQPWLAEVAESTGNLNCDFSSTVDAWPCGWRMQYTDPEDTLFD